MSIIIEDLQNSKDGNPDLWLMTKGADSIILPRLNQETNQAMVKKTQEFVDIYAKEGLRTLFVAQKKLTRNEYNQWNFMYDQAMNSVINRDEEVAKICNVIECNLELVGSTAIEDKLQDGV